MADISVEFSVVDRFSEAMNKFSEMVEKCSGGVEDLSHTANETNEKIDKISNSSTIASTGVKGLGVSMMVFNQALQAFQRIAEPVKQALDDIATKQRVLAMFSDDAGRAFNKFAEIAANSLGRVEGEIRNAGLKWQRIGIGGDNILELIQLADRFANLNPDKSFEDVAETFKDAIKSKDVGGLAELLGGGEGVELKLRRGGVERMLRQGNISGALDKFKQIADSFGYTQEKADKMGSTIDKKLRKIANVSGNYIRDLFSDVVAKIEPYVNRLLKWLQSDDVREALQKVKQVLGLITDALVKVVDWVILAVKAVYKFVETNKEIILTAAAVFGVFWAFSKLPAIIAFVTTLVIKCATTISLLLSKAMFAIPLAIVGVALVFRKIYSNITGSSVSLLETLVGIFVGGTVQIVTGIAELAQRLWNGIVDITEGGINGIIGGIEYLVNWFNSGFDEIRRNALSFVQGLVQDIMGAIDMIANTGLGEKLGLKDALDTLKEVNRSIEAAKRAGHETVHFGRVDFSEAKANVIDSVGLSADAIGFVMDKVNGIKDSIQSSLFGDNDNALDDIVDELGALSGMADDLGKIRGSIQKEQDLRWMKEMAEQRFVNEVNLRQLTPTINLQVKGANSSPQEYAKALARELQQMADAGTYNAYGDIG
jgi:methyl-accepting chemotaxis protein